MYFRKRIDKQIGSCYTFTKFGEYFFGGNKNMSRKEKLKLDPTYFQAELSVTAIYTTFSYYYTPNFIFHGEWHDAWEFVYAISGEVIIETEEQTLVLEAGQGFLHKPNEFHNLSSNKSIAPNVSIITFECSSSAMKWFEGKIFKLTALIKNFFLLL